MKYPLISEYVKAIQGASDNLDAILDDLIITKKSKSQVLDDTGKEGAEI